MNIRFLAVLLLACLPAAADLAKVQAEPNLEKRSKLALDNAEQALKLSRSAYGKGDSKQAAAAIEEIRESVALAETSLQQTGKDPRRSPKWFKRAELQTRELSKKLDAFSREMSYEDRDMLKATMEKVQQVHENLLTGIMEGKKK